MVVAVVVGVAVGVGVVTLVNEALTLGAQLLVCPVHNVEQWLTGSLTKRAGHYIEVDGRRTVCAGGEVVKHAR